MLKFELRKIFGKRIDKILLLVALVLAVLFSVFAINGPRYIESDGSAHKGIDSARLLAEQKNQWKGTLSPELFAQIVEKNHSVKSQYAGEYGLPDDIYAQTEQAYLDITDLMNEMATPEGDYNPTAIDSLDEQKAKKLYETRQANINQIIKEEATTPKQQEFLKKLYGENDIPFQYEAAESWKAASLLGEEYGLVIVLLVGFLAAGIFSDEFQYKADAIFFSTKCGRTKAVHAKIQAGLLMTTVIYWSCMAVFTLISFGVMGIGGAGTTIQIEWCYSIYQLSYGQYYLVIMLSGFVACLLSASITMLISAKLHSASVAACIPFILFCVSPFLGRALPFHTFFNLTPDQLMNVCNSIKNIAIYQIGQFVFRPIPFVMGLYVIVALVFLPITYRFYHRYTIKS